jgi:hypothetical protein
MNTKGTKLLGWFNMALPAPAEPTSKSNPVADIQINIPSNMHSL